ncbi:MAG: dienelactone hydrolase family protein [Planctomycetaceae bacterium]
MNIPIRLSFQFCASLTVLLSGLTVTFAEGPLPPDVKPLDWQGDIASRLVDAADAFLLREIDESVAVRDEAWKLGGMDAAALVDQRRKRLAKILGVRDPRVHVEVELITTTEHDSLIARGDGYDVHAVRWTVLDGMTAEGLLLLPHDEPKADVVALPDADQTPEMIAGLAPGVPFESQFARVLAENGCRVLIPTLISRHREPRNGRAILTHREYLYRPSFVLGRHLIGFELQKVFAAIDAFRDDEHQRPIGVVGYGEGGLLALDAAALDDRIDAALVSGYFDDRRTIWQQPIDRNVFGLLDQFGDAELAAMAGPGKVVIEAAKGPELTIPGEGGAPATLVSPPLDRVRSEAGRANDLIHRLFETDESIALVVSGDGRGPFGSPPALDAFLKQLRLDGAVQNSGVAVEPLEPLPIAPEPRLRRQIAEIDRFTQRLLAESPYVRAEFMKDLDTSSIDAYEQSAKPYRDLFRTEIIGAFDEPLVEPNPRARQTWDTPKWTGHEIVLDVFDDFFLYGVLLVPKDVEPGQRRPVVVCQHGLEGRPTDTFLGDHRAYHDFAAKLAERGFVVFAPQHLYLFEDRFRTLQRKANPLGKTLFSLMVPQHEQLLKWLATLPFVDDKRIGFYGLSYGGKSAMRIPALVEGYALSICSADFNDWVWKNASTRAPHSYVWTKEYEIFEFDLGSTFNYSEMAALIAPRPFMVERGHFDGVAPDERVASEYAKIRFLYAAKLKIPDRTDIEFFDGPHTINGQGTFRFLHRHLGWPGVPKRTD